MRFAETYKIMFMEVMQKHYAAQFECRGLAMARETVAVSLPIDVFGKSISVFSHKDHRVVPIRFVLAELCHILAGRDDLESLLSYNTGMAKYSHDGATLAGAYGARLSAQLPRLIERITADKFTRQACGVIFREDDCVTTTRTSVPCNVFLQFLYRRDVLNLHVTSRSSDFVTGFSIDTIHWQALLVLMANQLNVTAGVVYYSIASLHVYQDDMPVVENWKMMMTMDNTYEHMLKFELPLQEVINNCVNGFKGGLSVRELSYLLGLSQNSIDTALELEQLFLYHRNKLKR